MNEMKSAGATIMRENKDSAAAPALPLLLLVAMMGLYYLADNP